MGNGNGMEMGENWEKEMERDGNGTGISQTLLKNFNSAVNWIM